ncbi:MAG: chorismate synthase [Firmicutes bacterium]|nr:chorismate synthase [Bacillota bacterium]
MGSIYKNGIGVSIFGESHGEAIGGVIDGFPSGVEIDMDHILWLMDRRRPGKNKMSTTRKETDIPRILSGVFNGFTTGTPISFVIENNNKKSKDYSKLMNTPRPSHGDYSGLIKYKGFNDYRGGGHFSGRLTAPIVFIGALCEQVLNSNGIKVFSKVESIGGIYDTDIESLDAFDIRKLRNKKLPLLSDEIGKKIEESIEEVRKQGDSIGGSVKTYIVGLKAGLGNPIFDNIEGHLARLLFSVPGIKSVEFGLGKDFARSKGSEVNDEFYYENGIVKTYTNNNGGINGGISNGMPIVHTVAMKPTPSIFKNQRTVDLKTGENVDLQIEGRHDPCIVPRAIPVIEAISSIGILDLLVKEGELR